MSAKILYGEANEQVMAEHIKIFEKAGYSVVTALGRAAVEQALKTNTYGLLILGHTLSKDDRHHLPYMAKKANPAIRILVLHASCKHPKVDISIDSRFGEYAVLQAIAQLAGNAKKERAVAAVA